MKRILVVLALGFVAAGCTKKGSSLEAFAVFCKEKSSTLNCDQLYKNFEKHCREKLLGSDIDKAAAGEFYSCIIGANAETEENVKRVVKALGSK